MRDDVGEWIDAANASPDMEVRRENFCKVADAIREDILSFPILQFSEGSVYSNRSRLHRQHLGIRHLGRRELVAGAGVSRGSVSGER